MLTFTPEQDRAVNRAIDALLVSPRTRADNKFFEDFGPGNVVGGPHLPYERFKWYEALLRRIRAKDPTKYAEVHKGTPFYFMGWLGFDLGNYQKGLFYMDAAVSEDRRDPASPTSWRDLPAAKFLQLKPDGHAAGNVVRELRKRLGAQVDRFVAANGPSLTLDSLALRLAMHLLEMSTIISNRRFLNTWPDAGQHHPIISTGGASSPHG